MIMAVQSIGGVSATAAVAPTGGAAPTDAARRAAADNKDSTIVVSRVTRTRDDGSTVTTITYADGHTKVETTPPKFSAAEAQAAGQGQGQSQNQGGGEARVTAVDILA
jgi:hypothetical protein